MQKTITIYFLLFILCSTDSYAQVLIQGHIVNEKGENMSHIPLVLRQLPDSTIFAYAYSDDNGKYELTYNGTSEKLLISISGMDIAPQNKQIESISQTVNFKTTVRILKLKEVIVKSSKIWNVKDTINYLVSSFSDRGDVVIGDVLKKMPGIQVDENGQIRYQGKPINKFYIESMDMLQGRYGIATNNISAKDVSTVQILENHQPIKALEDVRISNDAAINLKLKDGAKGTLSIMAQLGIGVSPLLWENELTGMYFAKKKQNMTVYKSNNSGLDLSRELHSFTSSNAFGDENILAVAMPSPPNIDQSRYLFNNSNAVTINNLIKPTENRELNFNLIYLNDHDNKESKAHTSYYLPNQNLLITDEEMTSSKNIDKLEIELRYNKNDTASYLNNYLNAEGMWENNLGRINSDQAITQRLRRPTFKINNLLHWIKKNNKEAGAEFVSNVGFKSTPQTLSISPGLYSEIFNEGEDFSTLRQKAQIYNFYVNNRYTLLSPFMLGKVRVNPNMELNIESRQLKSDIYTLINNCNPILNPADSMRNNMDWFRYTTGLGFQLKYYTIRNLKVEISFPVFYYGIHINNKVERNKDNIHRLSFQPTINLSYDLSNLINLTGNYNFYNQIGNLHSIYTGYILQNYRSLNHYDGNLSEAKGNRGNISLSYKDIMNMFFISGGITYNHIKMNMLYQQEFKGILSVTSSVKKFNSLQNIAISGRMSKGFDWKNVTTTLETSYNIYHSEQLRQSKLIDYRMDGLNIALSLAGKPISFMSISYKGIWSRNTSKIDREKSTPAIKSFVNEASLNINLSKDLSLNFGSEYYYNSASLTDKCLFFGDLGATYNRESMDFRLMWNNIFDTNNYITAYYGDMNTYQNIYHIRPSNVMLKVRFKLK